MATPMPRQTRATIYDVARAAKVSPATVSRMFAGHPSVAPATRDRVAAVAAELGYRPNPLARNLSSRKSDMMAILLPDIRNPFFAELVKAVQSAAGQHGYSMMICNTEEDPELERHYLDGLISRQVKYVFAVGLTLSRRAVEAYVAAGLVFIALDRGVNDPGCYVVESDNRMGGELAVRHLIDLGHRRIAHIAGPPRVALSRDRRRGYVEGLAAAGLKVNGDLVVESEFSEQGGAEAYASLIRRRPAPTAIFAADDLIAIGAVAAARRDGCAVPEDVSIIGFDDVLMARYMSPPLTTIRQNAMAMGEQAVGLIVAPETARQRKIQLPVSLQVRGTTSVPPNGSATRGREKT
jgi:DNA-binding LacI/PurR family transcriptional regulator